MCTRSPSLASRSAAWYCTRCLRSTSRVRSTSASFTSTTGRFTLILERSPSLISGKTSKVAMKAPFSPGEAGIAGHGHVVGLHGRAELLQGIAQDLAANLAGIAGGHQLHGRLAGTETIHAHIPGDLRQALANFGLHLLLIEVESDTAVEAFEGFHGCCHQVFLKRRYIYPGSCGSRQGMARLVRSEPNSHALGART